MKETSKLSDLSSGCKSQSYCVLLLVRMSFNSIQLLVECRYLDLNLKFANHTQSYCLQNCLEIPVITLPWISNIIFTNHNHNNTLLRRTGNCTVPVTVACFWSSEFRLCKMYPQINVYLGVRCSNIIIIATLSENTTPN